MKQKVTIADVASHCHVSKSSVSRYLNNGYVSEENKEKIQKAIEELGFERDFFASRIKSKHSQLIGIIAHDITRLEHAFMLQGISRQLMRLGYQGMIQLSDGSAQKEMECLQNMSKQGVDGVIFLDCKEPNHVKELVQSLQMKVLFANQPCEFATFLGLEEEKAGNLVGNYLLEKQLHSICYLGELNEIAKQRKKGCMKAYEDHLIPCTYEHLEVGNEEAAYAAGTKILERKPEVVICAQEQYGLALNKYLQEVHVHVPQNISIICFGTGTQSAYCYPALDVVTFDFDAFGANLVELICALIQMDQPHWKESGVRIVKRESVR